MNQNSSGVGMVTDGVMMEQRPTIKAIQNSKGEWHFEIKAVATSSTRSHMFEAAGILAETAQQVKCAFIAKGLKVAA